MWTFKNTIYRYVPLNDPILNGSIALRNCEMTFYINVLFYAGNQQPAIQKKSTWTNELAARELY